MNNRRIARIIAVILAAVMLFSIAWVVLDSVVASARVTQAEIDALREEKRGYERRKLEIQSQINSIQFERMTELAKKQVLDDRIMLTEMEIENIINTIEFYVVLISEKEVELVEAQHREADQLDTYKRRVRDMEENGIISYLEIVFDSTSFSDLLARLDFVSDIMQADERAYNNYIAATVETEAAKEALERTMLETEEERDSLVQKRIELDEQLAEAIALIEQIEANLASETALYNEVAAEEARIQREINAKVEDLRRQEEARRIAEANRVRGSGQLMWPVPGHGSVTSGYGMRVHPVFRVLRQHLGIDIGAPHGANVVAADRGTVVTSAYNSSYGNYIVISHGNGFTTLYAHLSSRRVSETDIVNKGQVIGLIGSTGISTGPHLHFEVTQNGSRVNPMHHL